MKKMISMLFLGIFLIGTGCNSGLSIGNNDPNTVLEKFLNALAKKDMDEAEKYVTKESESFVNMMKMGIKMAGETENQIYKKEDVEISEAVINGDRATINVKNKESGDGTNFILKKEEGDWKVAFDKASFMEMSGQKMEPGDLENMQNGFSGENLKEATDAIQDMNEEDIKKAGEAIDSLQKKFEELNKDGKMDEAMKEATKMLEQMQKKGK